MDHPLPYFSIVIPTYARPVQLAACLEALARLRYPRDRFEVIVVDDDSPIPAETVAASFLTRLTLTVLTQSRAGPAAARNQGARLAKGDTLVFTDDDCAPAPDLLDALARRMAVTPVAAIGGKTVNALAGNPFASASQLLIDYLYDYHARSGTPYRFFTSNNLALPAARFHDVGGFDESFSRAGAEDREFCGRWRDRGFPLVFAPDVVVYHAHPLTLRGFWRQHVRYGRGAARFHRLRAERTGDSLRIEPLDFYLSLIRYPFTRAGLTKRLLLSTLLLVSQAATTSGFLAHRVELLFGNTRRGRRGS